MDSFSQEGDVMIEVTPWQRTFLWLPRTVDGKLRWLRFVERQRQTAAWGYRSTIFRIQEEPLDRYDASPQWPWFVAILLVFAYGLWKGA
jgi:hypothetical protein